MNKQKTSNNDYLKIVEINENIFLFSSFLNEEHSEKECATFCLDMLERCPELKQKIKFKNNDKFNLSTVRMMYGLYGQFADYIYEFSGIEKNIKPKKDIIKETDSFIKRKVLEVKNLFIKSIILIVSVLLFALSFYVEEQSSNTVLVAIATGLFSSLIFEYLVKIQKDHRENKRREINIIVSKFKQLKEDLSTAKENYSLNENDEMNFYDFIELYEGLYKYIQRLKAKISLNTVALKIDVKSFECYYQEKLDKEIKLIYDNYTDMKKLYSNRKSEYKEILLKPYGLAIDLIDNIISLYVIDFSFLKEKENKK